LNQYQKLGGQTIIYGLGNIVPRILNYAVLTVYFTRRFSVEDYGIITELYAYVAILMVLLTYGMETGLFKFSIDSIRKQVVYTTAFLSVLFTSLVFFAFILIMRNRIAVLIGYTGNSEYIVYLGMTLALDAISAIIFAKLRIENKVRQFAVLKILNVLVTVFFVFLFLEILPAISRVAENEWYVHYMAGVGVGYVFIANALASLIIFLLLFRGLFSIRFKLDWMLLKHLLYYALPLLISGMAGIFNETIDRILLRKLLPENYNSLYELGIYGANYRIAVLMTILVQMFRYAAEPFFFNLYQSRDAKIVYANVLKYFTIFLMMVFLTVALGIDVFKYFIDSKYYEGLSIVPLVLMANVIVGMLFNVNMWYKLTGHTFYGIYITGLGALVTIVLNIFLIPLYSYVACAWIHLTSNFLMLVLTYYFGQRIYKIQYDVKNILLYVLIALGFFLLARLLRTDKDFFNIGIGAIFVILYLLLCNKREGLYNIFFRKNEGKNS
jgi:O-antigen/teichoic acid export membrane protein